MSLELRQLVSGGAEEPVEIGGHATMLGSLASNQITLIGPGIEPIHGMIERLGDGRLRITDLGTLAGIKVNGTRIEVETVLADGDAIEVGSTKFRVIAGAPQRPAPTQTVKSDPPPKAKGLGSVVSLDAFRSRLLFSPKEPNSRGRMLEVVAYWGDTVLNVDQFHPDLKGQETVTIGDPSKAHFISGGREWFSSRVLANVESDGCVLKLTKDMKARVRQQGEVKKISGLKQLHLGPTDYAHIQQGAVHFFLHYANQPKVDLPRNRRMDAVTLAIAALSTVTYLVLVILALTITPKPILTEKSDTPDFDPEIYKTVPKKKISLAQVKVPIIEVKMPEKPKEPKPEKPTLKQKDPPKPKPEVKPPTPVTPKEMLQPKPPTPAPKPQAQPTPQPVPTASPKSEMAQTAAGNPAPIPAAKPGGAKSPSPQFSTNASAAVGKGGPNGQKSNQKPGNSGGPGATTPKLSGALKGNTAFNNPGQDAGKLNQPSLPNLKQLGAGLGQVLTNSGGVPVQFKSSAGGMGKKMGSASKDYNMGGPGGGTLLGLPGSGDKLGGWGAGPGGVLGGGNGPGGGIAGLGKKGGGGNGPGFGPGGSGGHGRADVQLPPQAPGISNVSVTPEEIMRVIRQHLNEIRHCYEQLLQRVPNAGGKMTTEFVIGLQGRVTSVSVPSTTLNDPLMRGCVTGKMQRWVFPKPRGTSSGVTVTYPFVFTPMN